MRRVRAFTLIELLVVIGIIAVLIAVLLPTLHTARLAARNTQCASNLRQLGCACTMYLQEYGSYPPPNLIMLQGDCLPNVVPVSLLNQLHRYLSFPDLPQTLSLSDVPPVVQCPFAMDIDVPAIRGPAPFPGQTSIATGYQYTGGLGKFPDPRGVVIPPTQIPTNRGRYRGVLWSDVLTWYSGSGLLIAPPGPGGWVYFHGSGNLAYNGSGYDQVTPLRGQNREYSDGSVQYVPRSMINLDLTRRDTSASYMTGPPANYCCFYWF